MSRELESQPADVDSVEAPAVAGLESEPRRLAFLVDASRILASSLDYEETLGNIARLTVPALAEVCLVDLLDEDGGIRRVGSAHHDAVSESIVRSATTADHDMVTGPQARVVRDGTPLLVREVTAEILERAARDEAHLRALRVLDPASVMIVPLKASERVLGTVTFVMTRSSGRRYTDDDLTIAQELAAWAGLAVEHAQLYRAARADLADRERAAEILERYRAVAQATNDVIYEWYPIEGRIVWSETLESAFGYPVAEVPQIVQWWKDRIHPDDRALATELLVDTLDVGDDVIAAEYRFRRADGSYATVLDRGRVLRDRAGRAVRVIGSMVDITARKRAEERQRFLAEASAILTSSLDYDTCLRSLARLSVPALGDFCLVDIVEEDGSIRRVEAAHADPDRQELMQKLLRYPPGRFRPEGITRALETGQPVLISKVDEAMLRGMAQDAEHLALVRAIAPVAFLIVPLMARQRTLGALTFARTTPGVRYTTEELPLAQDLADRAAMAIDNARLLMLAQQASQAKSEFLSMMSHEFRTPLTAIIGYTDLLSAEVAGPLVEQQKRFLSRVRTSAWHLLQIIEEILTFSRTETGREPVRTATVALSDVIREAREAVAALASHKRLALYTDLPPGELWIQTDPEKLRQILVNLLTNGIKYTDRGAVRLTVVGGVDTLCIRISDTGHGIERAHLERIFEPFWQIDQSATRSIGGTGLGLTIVRRLTDLLGGRIEVESTPGVGSTFTLHLPARPPLGR